MLFNETQPVSYKVLVKSKAGKTSQFNYVDKIEYTDYKTVVLHGNEQTSDGTMIRRDFVIERDAIDILEARVIKKTGAQA